MSTATKAEKYLERSATTTISLRREGKDTKSLLLQQAKSVAKHGEILQELKKYVTGVDLISLDTAVKTNTLLSQQISQSLLED